MTTREFSIVDRDGQEIATNWIPDRDEKIECGELLILTVNSNRSPIGSILKIEGNTIFLNVMRETVISQMIGMSSVNGNGK